MNSVTPPTRHRSYLLLTYAYKQLLEHVELLVRASVPLSDMRRAILVSCYVYGNSDTMSDTGVFGLMSLKVWLLRKYRSASEDACSLGSRGAQSSLIILFVPYLIMTFVERSKNILCYEPLRSCDDDTPSGAGEPLCTF